MKGLLLIAHGSKNKKTEETLKIIIEILRKKLSDIVVEFAFLQFSERNIEKGLDILVKKGITQIKVVPYFLFDGVHTKEDIPKEIEKFNQKNKVVDVSIANVLGVDERIIEVVLDRYHEE